MQRRRACYKDHVLGASPLSRVSEGRALWEPEVASSLTLWAPGFRPDANREVTGYQRHAWLARLRARPSHVSEPRETESQCPGPDGNAAPCGFTVLTSLSVHQGRVHWTAWGLWGQFRHSWSQPSICSVFPYHSRFSLGLRPPPETSSLS